MEDAHSLLLRLGPELACQMQPQDFCSEQMGMCVTLQPPNEHAMV